MACSHDSMTVSQPLGQTNSLVRWMQKDQVNTPLLKWNRELIGIEFPVLPHTPSMPVDVHTTRQESKMIIGPNFKFLVIQYPLPEHPSNLLLNAKLID